MTSVIIDALHSLATPIDNLANDPDNARRGDVAAVRRSLNVFGQRKPIVVKRTGVDANGGPCGIVIAGNHTLMAAIELGWTEIAAVFVEDDANTARAYALADNRTSELAHWDGERLAGTLRELGAESFDLSALGWNDADLAIILNEPPDIDELAEKHGDPEAADAWPALRIRVAPHVAAGWRGHLDTFGGNENEALAKLLGLEPEIIEPVWTPGPA